MSKPAPRGIRLNNPGNIRHSPRNAWQGMAEDQPDPAFVKFTAPEWGIRAVARTLLNYQRKGVDSVQEIIDRWAPPSENDTDAYVAHVAQAVGVDPTAPIDVDSYAVMRPLVEAIIRHENGQQPYSGATLDEGLRRAGVVDAPKVSFVKKAGAQVTTGVAVCCAAVSQAAEPVKEAAKSLADYTGAPIIANVSTALLTVAGVATLAGVVHRYLKHRKGL